MDAAIASESKYEDDGCIGHDEEVKCEDTLSKLRSPAKFSTVRSVGQTFGGGMFMNLLEDAMSERERLHDAAMVRSTLQRLHTARLRSSPLRSPMPISFPSCVGPFEFCWSHISLSRTNVAGKGYAAPVGG